MPPQVNYDMLFRFFTFLIALADLSSISNQINHLIGLRSSKDYYRPGGVSGVYGKGHLGVSFYVGRCVLREWVVGRGGLDGYFGEQGLPFGHPGVS